MDRGVITSFLPCVAAITQTIKCSHERSVHLFIDSLLHASMQSTAYQCSDMGTFSQGLCLSCKKGHCNTLGYHVRQEWQGKKSKKLFLATRAQSPFKGECGWPMRQPLIGRVRSSPKSFPVATSGSALSVLLKPKIPDGDVDTASLSCPPCCQVLGGENLILSGTILGSASLHPSMFTVP